MKANTVVELSDGRIGTICYNWLDGYGGKFGIHIFDENGDLPAPDFLLRRNDMKETTKQSLRNSCGNPDLEFVGENYRVVSLSELGDY